MSGPGRAGAALVRLFRVLARISPDCPNVLERIGDQDVAAPILRRLAAGEDPTVSDLRVGVATVYSLLRDHGHDVGPLLEGASVGSIEEMRSFLERRPFGIRRLAGITLLWGARLADHASVNGATHEVWSEKFAGVLTGSSTGSNVAAVCAMLRHAEALLPEATPRAALQAALTSLEAHLDELRLRTVPALTLPERAAELTRRVRYARHVLSAPLSPPSPTSASSPSNNG